MLKQLLFFLTALTVSISTYSQCPTAAFQFNTNQTCNVPQSVFFTDQSTMPDTWHWDYGDGNSSTQQNPVYAYATPGVYTVTLTVTDTISGCTDVTTATVNVGDTEAPMLNCIGAVQVNQDTTNCTYTVGNYVPLVLLGDQCDPSPSITQTPVAGTVITSDATGKIVVTDASGNSDSCIFNIILNVPASPAFGYTSAIYCNNEPDPTPTISGTPGGTFASIPQGNMLIDPATGEIILLSSWPGSYTVTYTTPNACPVVGEVSIEILDAYVAPPIEITSCDSYTWDESGLTYTSSGTYNKHYVKSNGCDSLIVLDLTILQADTSVTPAEYSLTANALGATYQWLDCDNDFAPVAGFNAALFTPFNNGNYAVEVTQNGCVDTSACYIIEGLGLDHISSNALIKVSPNPTDGQFNINLPEIHQNIEVRVYNTRGQLVNTYNYKDKQNIKLELEGPAGVYFLEVDADSDTFKALKIVKS